MKQIALKCGAVVQVDDADYEKVAAYQWHLSHNGYAVRRVRLPDGSRPIFYMHGEIAGKHGDFDIDHADGNKLNNCRRNLRVATRTLNNANGRFRGGSSRFKGVCWHRQRGFWVAYISHDKHRQHLGCFASEEDAARAYDHAALANFGEFARTNLIQKEAHHAN